MIFPSKPIQTQLDLFKRTASLGHLNWPPEIFYEHAGVPAIEDHFDCST